MSVPTPASPRSRDSVSVPSDLELHRFLVRESDRYHAERAAEAFAGLMPALTGEQRRRLVALYTGDRLAEARHLRTEVARRDAAHEARAALGRRCVTVAVTISVLCAAFHVLVRWA